MAKKSKEIKQVLDIKWQSRKYRTAWYLTTLMTSLLVLPAIISLIITLLYQPFEFSVLPIEYYIPFITGIWFAYFGVNVMEHHKAFSVNQSGSTQTTQELEINIDSSGGQPSGSDND